MASLPNIQGNQNIRKPQMEAYYKILEYFRSDYTNKNALVVLPTGVGKTGVMALAPFGLCKKRMLIITPGTTIRNTVLDALDPLNADNFWYKQDVLVPGQIMPKVIEYDGKETPNEVLNAANIVILNIHKLQKRLDSSLINRVDSEFFDFIIIDEAHHSTASTWVDCVQYFVNAKVLKLTGTPFRTDGEKITGELIYKYSLSRAMANEYVKSLSNINYIPEELKLTIDDDEKLYSVDEILALKFRDQDWIARSVAYSRECSERVVDASISELRDKRSNSDIPHKIIAVACSIAHAKQIAELYTEKGISSVILHSELPESQKEKAYNDINNHRVQAVINVAMLGEGYDHPYLSIAAIFRPFKSELAYAQFIGRVLRKINDQTATPKDNIAKIISHQHLYLNPLWEKYKKEIQESEIITKLKVYDELLDNEFNDNVSTSKEIKNDPLGSVTESKAYSLISEDYLDTELLRKSKEQDKIALEKIKELAKLLNIDEEQAKIMYQQTQNINPLLSRPDLLYKNKRGNLDDEIREIIVPSLIESFGIDSDANDLKDCGLFIQKYWWIPKKVNSNNAMLAMYYNVYLKNKIGKGRDQWTNEDFDLAFNYLKSLNEMVEGILNKYYNKQK